MSSRHGDEKAEDWVSDTSKQNEKLRKTTPSKMPATKLQKPMPKKDQTKSLPKKASRKPEEEHHFPPTPSS